MRRCGGRGCIWSCDEASSVSTVLEEVELVEVGAAGAREMSYLGVWARLTARLGWDEAGSELTHRCLMGCVVCGVWVGGSGGSESDSMDGVVRLKLRHWVVDMPALHCWHWRVVDVRKPGRGSLLVAMMQGSSTSCKLCMKEWTLFEMISPGGRFT